MEDLTNIISSIGFPIFACVYMFKNNEKLISAINELSITLKGIDTRLEILEIYRNVKYNNWLWPRW